MKNLVRICFLIPVLFACASDPILNTNNTAMDVSPEQITSEGQTNDERIVWGGVIVAAHNLEDHTQLDLLAYPLDRELYPDTSRRPIGRFIVQHKGYLEIEDYAPGRKLTLVGTVLQLSSQAIGAAKADLPEVQSEEIHLWRQSEEQERPRFSFGLGISIGN